MKQLILMTVIMSLSSLAWAFGQDRGGGDPCEDQIKIVRDDIASWIQKGGPQGLKLSPGLSVEQYSQSMLGQISKAKIRCVGNGDKGFPVEVYGTPKVCKFETGMFKKATITCDRESFLKMKETDQYVLVHHEYAGLAGIEQPTKDDSVYTVSNQISSYLVDTVVKRLAVKKETRPPSAGAWRELRGGIDAEFGRSFGDLVSQAKFVDCDVKVFNPETYECDGSTVYSNRATFIPKSFQTNEKPEKFGIKKYSEMSAHNIYVNQMVCDDGDISEEYSTSRLYYGKDPVSGVEIVRGTLRNGFAVLNFKEDQYEHIDLDSTYYLDAKGTSIKKATFKIGKSIKKNIGTLNSPKYIDEFKMIWSFTCNSK